MAFTKSKIMCGSRHHRVGVPEVWLGSGDENNQPAVIPGGWNTLPHKRFASAHVSQCLMICLRADDMSESRAESLLLDEESAESDDPLKEGAKTEPFSAFAKKHSLKTTAARLPHL